MVRSKKREDRVVDRSPRVEMMGPYGRELAQKITAVGDVPQVGTNL